MRRPRANAGHVRLFVRGKGGTEREVPVPEETQAALEAWLAVHPLARGRGLRDEHPLFVRLGCFPGAQPPEPLSGQAVHKLVRACALGRRRPWAARTPTRLAHLLGHVAAGGRRAHPPRLQPADRLVHVLYDFLRTVVRDARKTLTRSADDKK